MNQKGQALAEYIVNLVAMVIVAGILYELGKKVVDLIWQNFVNFMQNYF